MRSRWTWGIAALVFAIVSTATLAALAEEPGEPSLPPEETASRPPTSAEQPERRVILLVRTPGDEETILHLRSEFRDGGWRILEIRPDERFETEPLASAAERERVAAAVRVDAVRYVVELWVYRAEGSVEETLTSSGERLSGRVLAVRVAEALRARGLALPPKPDASVTAAASPTEETPKAELGTASSAESEPAPEAKPSERHPPRLSLELGPGLVLSPGGLGPLAVVEVGLRLEFARILSLSLAGLIPVSRQTLEGEEGAATVSTAVAGGLFELEWARLSYGGLRSGVGGGVSVTSMSGRATSGFEAAEDTVTVFTPLLRTTFHLNLKNWLRLRTGVLAGLTLPSVRIEFGEREAATWGRPFVVASLILEASSP
jgi:hypothetical protein